MVFHQSDSTGTLVSLDRTQPVLFKPEQQQHGEVVVLDPSRSSSSQESQQYVQTSLLLEIDECDNVDDEEDGCDIEDDCWMGQSQRQSYPSPEPQRVPLFLPVAEEAEEDESVSSVPSSKSMIKVDEYLNQLPYFQEKCDELLSLEPRRFTAACSHSTGCRVLYCHQGERASSTSDQNDVIVSDRATTCHILAMRSTTTARTQSPMASMAHLDGPQYTDCILSMVREHVTYHTNNNCGISERDVEEEKKFNDGDEFSVESTQYSNNKRDKITLEFHVMGGFNDEDGTSSELSEWLIRLLANLASSDEFSSRCGINIDFVLKTCAITSMNDTGYQCPVGRGLAMDIETGRVYLAQCDNDMMGPAPVLRSVYLWTARKHLRVIHSALRPSSTIVIEPFEFRPFQHIPALLKLNDRALLNSTSTSPDVEEDGFCDNVRRSLRFLQEVSCEQVFGRHVDQRLVFERRCHRQLSSLSSNKNQQQWDLVLRP